ncbi:Glycerol 2-dehydrogenase (NADP(+)) [Hypsizygus marmoreus]|uniref:Glycerol 2-dehydrogenase (NADP(+)) n=1 Tax=Hypsizygus marmoreus TaxID=39966 RepID=A0A369JZY7_HYPMA|nr:Glycerol 2-dehydrogenase (NADP(+)) [Hypsizygus marmoreus]
MATISTFTFNDGTKIPSVGMGCWMGAAVGLGDRVYEMCLKALKNGYRHFDTASKYGNEKQVGAAIRASGIPRSEIYITTKLENNYRDVCESFERSLRELDCEYIDLYLIHWPQHRATSTDYTTKADGHADFINAWKEMEKLLRSGKVKTIGVSNFSVKTLNELLPHCTIIPAPNQVEMHPCLPQTELKKFCDEKGILLTAYSPLGRSTVFFDEPIIKAIAERLTVSPAQVVLSWAVQRGTIVVPKSEDEGRMTANITLVQLSSHDMKAIDGIHLQPGMHKSLLKYHAPDGTVFGWTYERLGWNMTTGGLIPTH